MSNYDNFINKHSDQKYIQCDSLCEQVEVIEGEEMDPDAVDILRNEYTKCENIIIYRSLKTACHELCHVFGMTHCPYYECLMNGSNLIEEADKKPFALCPICIRKIETYFQIEGRLI